MLQTATENEKVTKEFLGQLLDRGLKIDEGLLVVIDGSKGLRAAVRKVFRDKAIIQSCQWHKRENVVSYLPKSHQKAWRKKLQRAYEQPTYEAACQALERLKPELRLTQCFGGQQPGRRAGGNPDPPSFRTLQRSGQKF